MKIACIIVNYNGSKDTIECLWSVKQYNNEVVTIVVDNASASEDIASLEKSSNLIDKLILNSDNDGFAVANNIGIMYAQSIHADYIVLLNNDTVLMNDIFSIMLKSIKEDEVVAPLIYDINHQIWFAGGAIDYYKGYAYHYSELKHGKIDFLTGCCFMISAKNLEKIGLLPEEYFMYCEDVDYSLMMQNANLKLSCNYDAKILHKVGVSSGGQKSKFFVYYSTRNRLYLLRKYKFPKRAYFYTLITRYVKYFLAHFRKNQDGIIKKAIIDYKNNNMGKNSDL